MRRFLLLGAAVVLAGCASKGTTGATGGASATTGAPAASTTSTTAPPTTTTTIPVINLSGSGQTATQPFTVTGGLTVFRSTCGGCQTNFIVDLLDSSGQTKDNLVNTIGAYDGSKGEQVGVGSYSLKISADAAWTVVIVQPRNPALPPLPQTFSGKGDGFVGPFDAAHAVRIQARNTAGPDGGNFIVDVLAADGSTQDNAFNELGSFTGSTVTQMAADGPYFLDISSDGSWTLNLSKP